MKNSTAVPSTAEKRRFRDFIGRSFVARRAGQCQAAPAMLDAPLLPKFLHEKLEGHKSIWVSAQRVRLARRRLRGDGRSRSTFNAYSCVHKSCVAVRFAPLSW